MRGRRARASRNTLSVVKKPLSQADIARKKELWQRMKETDPKMVEVITVLNQNFGKVNLDYYKGPAGEYGEKSI